MEEEKGKKGKTQAGGELGRNCPPSSRTIWRRNKEAGKEKKENKAERKKKGEKKKGGGTRRPRGSDKNVQAWYRDDRGERKRKQNFREGKIKRKSNFILHPLTIFLLSDDLAAGKAKEKKKRKKKKKEKRSGGKKEKR